MEENSRQSRLIRIKPYLSALKNKEEQKINKNKGSLLILMQDLKDEGNTLFKESKFKEAWEYYHHALFVADILEESFYHCVEKEFLATLFCNASLCCIKINDFESALKDAEKALELQEKNIKAFYRKSLALKELGRHKEALKVALQGKVIDSKNNFDDLIDDLKAIIAKSSTKKKNNDSKTTNIEVEISHVKSEPLKEASVKNMAPKKKKGQINNNGSAKPAPKLEPKQKESDSDPDSDSSEDDTQFATKMFNMKRQTTVNPTPINSNIKPSAPKPNAAAPPASAKSADITGVATAKAKVNPQQNKQPITQITWPLQNYDFKLACRICFVKTGEGLKGYQFRENCPHSCTHDVLLVRAKKSPQLNWLKVRLRPANTSATMFVLCNQFKNGVPCRIGENNCTFGHNQVEINLWELDRSKTFSIQNFISNAAREGIYSSDILDQRSNKQQTVKAQPYIPGLQINTGNSKARATPPPQSPPMQTVSDVTSLKSPTPSASSTKVGGTSGLSTFSPPPTTSVPHYPHTAEFFFSANQPAFSQFTAPPPVNTSTPRFPPQTFVTAPRPNPPPPVVPNAVVYHLTSPMYPTVPRQTIPVSAPVKPPGMLQQQTSPNKLGQPQVNTALPNLSKPPPRIGKLQNPLPDYKFRLFCPQCLNFAGRPWYYTYDNTLNHLCAQSILAYYVQDNFGHSFWVQVRERASHRNFQGSYILCNSIYKNDISLCKYKDSCSFAHNGIEQRLWKMEQGGTFDIGEFIHQNKQNSPVTGSSSLNYVRYLMEKFGGYFRFICRDCFFAPHPMISSQGEGNFCTGSQHHQWAKCKIIAHVLNGNYTPIDQSKFHYEGAFYLMCRHMQFCRLWLENKCNYAHSLIEKAVWMMERDIRLTREELVLHSSQLYQISQYTPSAPTHNPTEGKSWLPPTAAALNIEVNKRPENSAGAFIGGTSINLVEYCRICWSKGQKSPEDGKKDKCTRGHSNFKLNSVFVALPAGKEVRTYPSELPLGMKLILCNLHPKCTRQVCRHPHGEHELEVWTYMMKHKIKNLREMCEISQNMQKSKTRDISMGESVVSISEKQEPFSRLIQARPTSKIIAPGDLVISEHYCQYCGVSCNSTRQWDEHCMSEKHVENVNSDKEHQWNYRQPPWGQGNNLALCAKHIHDQSCQYSHVPDMYNLCVYAHSQEELDEWQERYEWRQYKRVIARERHMFSYTESLLEDYYSQDNSVNVMSENLPGVIVICGEDLKLFKSEKNAIFTWTFHIYTEKQLHKVALLHNKDRLHFSLIGTSNSHPQVASGDTFLSTDELGRAYYVVSVHFTASMFGSFIQWVVFDFGSRPVLVRKLAVEIGATLQQEKVRELRENLSFDRWTSQNKIIVRQSDPSLDDFTEKLLLKYKEPVSSEDVVTLDSITELNQHNYIHKMHKLLELEEITRHHIISSYNLVSEVSVAKTIDEPGNFIIAANGDLFLKVNLTENLTEDTLAGKLVLSSVRTVLLAKEGNTSKKVFEAFIVGESNYNYDGRCKDYIYLIVNAETSSQLGLTVDSKPTLEIQFQMDRKFFCRMHYALDSLQTTDVLFPDIVKFKPGPSEISFSMKIRSNVLNEDQMTAVRHIVVEREGYTPPFIMYGPFGTGKTETLAQATMTLLRERPNVRILICTQSNSAADLYITKHLSSFVKKMGQSLKVLRLNAPERKKDTVPDEVKQFCYGSSGMFQTPPKEAICQYQLVLTTVENSMQLTKLGLHNHFTHIFIDEAGQTLECEILMVLTLASTKTCVVLTGDHQQIGPTVYSPEARKQKFDISILVRLYNYYEQMANCGISVVSEKSKHSPMNIFLSINYRTKPEILRFISSVFYKGPDNLKAYGNVPSVMGITPLVFCVVQGTETQNRDSTSYLNHAEAQEVVERVKELIDRWPQEWGPMDAKRIAVISFYSDQIKHIRHLMRSDRQRPYLKQVDVGNIHSFQGKEVRALFISTVRTVNMLQEPHIIKSLEQGEDIGDLGFLSNPRLLNTALTRTQSYVAVVGDPVALCLIGECIQVWRTYLKHCSNMKSVHPITYNYDMVKNHVINIQIGPQGRVVDMLSRHGQETLNIQSRAAKATKAVPQKSDIQADDAMFGDSMSSAEKVSAWKTVDTGYQPVGPKVKSSIPKDNGHLTKLRRQFSEDDLHISSSISCEDIIFQMVRGNQTEAGENGLIKLEGIVISELDGFAVLEYNPNIGQEPFKITSKDDDFITFIDNENSLTYINWSSRTLLTKLISEPERYLKCSFNTNGTEATAQIVGPIPRYFSGDMDIAIEGQFNRGHALNGDIVVVEIIGRSDSGKFLGQVKGILERAQDPTNRLFVCTADPNQPGILNPINPEMPRFYCLTSSAHVKLARKGNLCIYKLVSNNCLEFSQYKTIDSHSCDNQLYIVRYLTWQSGFLLPFGVVIGIFTPDDSLDNEIKILEVEHNLYRSPNEPAEEEAKQIFTPELSSELMKTRQDLTHTFCFTISDLLTEDLEMAISVNQVDSNYEVGFHLSDVVAYVDRFSALDRACENRGASLFPLGKEPKHMLPAQASTDYCSLKPGFDRLAVSVLLIVDEAGNIIGPPRLFRSVINCKQKFSHAEVEEILQNPEESQTDYLKSCVIVLYQLTYLWRCERLGNSHISPDLEADKRLAQHSHLMLSEVQLYVNGIVGELLVSRFKDSTPLLVQPGPQSAQLDKWKKENAGHAFNSIPMARAFNQEQVCHCKKACTCVFTYMRENQLARADTLSVLSESWLMIAQAVSDDYKDFELAQDMISDPNNMPQLSVAANKLKAIQSPERYRCSSELTQQDRKHYGHCVPNYTNCTNPLRRYISMVVQRILVAFIEGAPNPYTPAEINDICSKATIIEQTVEKFHSSVYLLHLSSALKARPFLSTAVVNEVDKEKAVVLLKDLDHVPKTFRTVRFSCLSPMKVSAVDKNPDCVQLLWEERVYQNSDQTNQIQNSLEVKLEPDRFVCNVPTILWQRLLSTVREKDEPEMEHCVQEISTKVEDEIEQLSKACIEVISGFGKDGQMRHYVPFTLVLHKSQALQVQVSATMHKGLLTPCIQLINLTPSLDICLEHKTDQEKCFVDMELCSKAKATYNDENKYASEWQLPMLSMESAHQAVNDGERITVHNISINWTVEQETVVGEFVLSDSFCNKNSFQPDLGISLASTLLEGQPIFTGVNFSLDYLCVRYSNVQVPDEPALEESVAVLVNNGRPIVWVAHCLVTDVTKCTEGYLVEIKVSQSGMKIPPDLLTIRKESMLCTVEWIIKTPKQRVLDIAMRSLQFASSFAKDIIVGRRPINTIDPVPQETKMFVSSLSEEQESIISDSLRQPFSTVIGGPGVGKTALAARLALSLAKRNFTVDSLRKSRLGGTYTTHLMVCGPSEKSLDIITGMMVDLMRQNNLNFKIVRIYSEEIEERDFPLATSPKRMSRPSPTLAVMEEVALHHLIRKKNSPESVALLEQEMYLSMYGHQIAPAVQAALEKAQIQELKKSQIIVCSCVTSARPILKIANIKQVLIDDAGMISEAESLIPLVMHKNVNQFVLLGDLEMPEAHVDSKMAAQLGLSHCLLRRYTDRSYRLNSQFRNTPTLSSFPSSYFYESNLVTSRYAPSLVKPPAPTLVWPGESFPSIFCHVAGEESFSEISLKHCRSECDLINLQEVEAVVTLTTTLIHHHRISESAILILTATQAQASCIKAKVPRNVVVNTVLDSVGQESQYVILSTVRSVPPSRIEYPPSQDWICDHLGVMSEPRCINLAITRARTAFYIIGNKDLLGTCRPWMELIKVYRRRMSLM
ncbi:helicase with zinc finger domain 2-like isoform X1 [Biomphalaria glabrata]